MNSGTSTVSTATWQQTHFSVIPSRTYSSTPDPTIFSNAHLLEPRRTPSPSCCSPNEVIIHLSTTLIIPDYDRYWEPTPILAFQPTYFALDDGSLITSPFIQDLWNANLSLLVTGALAMLFTRNIFVSGDYIRRGKVKKKTLFYLLFISQILAPVSLVPLILSYFYKWTNCIIVIVLSCVSGAISLALLITGILGVKAYKCLNNSRFVFIMLGLFQCASTAAVVMDVATTQAARRISGSCVRTSDLQYTRYFVSIQFLESLFICCCFLYACWKSRGSPAARGRISLELSMEELPIEIPNDATDGSQPTRRGWWDYVPAPEKGPPTEPPRKINVFQKLRTKLPGLMSTRRPSSQRVPLRKPSKGDAINTIPPRPTTVRISESSTNGRPDMLGARGRNSPTPSSGTRLSRLVPRMELFRQVMRDELFYTTFITASCVIVAVLAVIGVNFKNGLTVTGWIALNWGLISLLAMHSFGRVVRRHEREALLTHPVTCAAVARAANASISARERDARARGQLNVSPSRRRLRRDTKDDDYDDLENPFSDARRIQDDLNSWDSGSESIYTASKSSQPPSPLVLVRPTSRGIQDNTPTTMVESGFPTSGRGTPVVPHDSTDGPLKLQGFSQSWLFAHNSMSEYSVTSEYSSNEKPIP